MVSRADYRIQYPEETKTKLVSVLRRQFWVAEHPGPECEPNHQLRQAGRRHQRRRLVKQDHGRANQKEGEPRTNDHLLVIYPYQLLLYADLLAYSIEIDCNLIKILQDTSIEVGLMYYVALEEASEAALIPIYHENGELKVFLSFFMRWNVFAIQKMSRKRQALSELTNCCTK